MESSQNSTAIFPAMFSASRAAQAFPRRNRCESRQRRRIARCISLSPQALTGRLEIHDGYAERRRTPKCLTAIGRSPSMASSAGKQTLPPTTQPFGPDLRITGAQLPIDDDLKNALPPSSARGCKRRASRRARHGRPRLPDPGKPGSDINYVFDARCMMGKSNRTAAKRRCPA